MSNKETQGLGRTCEYSTEADSETRPGSWFCLSVLALGCSTITSNHVPEQSQEGPGRRRHRAAWRNGPDYVGSWKTSQGNGQTSGLWLLGLVSWLEGSVDLRSRNCLLWGR